jgi:hypothetical protein
MRIAISSMVEHQSANWQPTLIAGLAPSGEL